MCACMSDVAWQLLRTSTGEAQVCWGPYLYKFFDQYATVNKKHTFVVFCSPVIYEFL